jgi:AAA family ATP:ADP antiporter
MFISILIKYLNKHTVRKYARSALAEYEDEAIGSLKEILANENADYQLRLAIPKVLSLIGTQESVNLLLDNLNQEDLSLRFQMLRGLNRLRTNFPYLKFGENRIRNSILRESKNYHKICAYLSNKELSNSQNIQDVSDHVKAEKALDLLVSLLNERLDNTLERIFRLLGLKYSPGDMYNAYRAIISNNQDLRANAVEFLENILDPNLKRIIISIIEYSTNPVSAEEEFKVNRKNSIFLDLLRERDSWLKVCTIFYIAEANMRNYQSEIQKLTKDHDSTVKETAEYALDLLINQK